MRAALKTFSEFTKPNPACVDCKLLMACLMSPFAVNKSASSPSSVYVAFTDYKKSSKQYKEIGKKEEKSERESKAVDMSAPSLRRRCA